MNLRYLLSAVLALAISLPALASAEPPAQVPVQGYLTDANGIPVDGTKQVTVKIFKTKSGSGTPVYQETLQVDATAGSFTAHLGSTKTLPFSIFEDNKDLWAELQVGSETLQPRLRIATAPYAATAGSAQNAEQLDGAPASDYQARISNQCSTGEAAHGVMQDGTLMCRSVASSIQTGPGLSKSSGKIRVAGGGITSSMIASNTIGQGDIGSGSIGNSELQSNSVTSGEITDGEVKSSDLGSGAVSTGKLASGAVTTGKIQNGTITSDDMDSSVTGHNDIDFNASGNLHIPTGEVDSSDIGSNSVFSSELGSGAVGNSEISNDAVTSSEIKNNSIKDEDLTYGCGSEYALPEETVDSFGNSDRCPFDDPCKAQNLPDCDSVPIGSLCEFDTACSSGTVLDNSEDNCNDTSNNCGNASYDVYYKVAP